MVVVASTGETTFPLGSWHLLGGENVSTRIRQTGKAARIDDYVTASGSIGADAIRRGLRSALGAPLVVEGRLWGAVIIGVTAESLLPAGTETRLGEFTELMATAIANTESRARAERLAEEQAGLHRVATLVARQAPQTEIFNAIAEECARLFETPAIEIIRYDGDSMVAVATTGRTFSFGSRHPLGGENVATLTWRTGSAARIDDYGTASGAIGESGIAKGLRSALGAPIIVEGQLWGALIIGVTVEVPLSPETEARLGEFTELMATAIANTESRARAERLAEEQAALRRVATLVAREASMLELFGAVTKEAMRVAGTTVGLLRFESDATATLVAQSDTPWPPPPLGTSFRLDGENLVTSLYRTGRAVRQDEWASATGEVSAMADVLGVRSSVATPIVVEGRLWGTMIATGNRPEPLPSDTEGRRALRQSRGNRDRER